MGWLRFAGADQKNEHSSLPPFGTEGEDPADRPPLFQQRSHVRVATQFPEGAVPYEKYALRRCGGAGRLVENASVSGAAGEMGEARHAHAGRRQVVGEGRIVDEKGTG